MKQTAMMVIILSFVLGYSSAGFAIDTSKGSMAGRTKGSPQGLDRSYRPVQEADTAVINAAKVALNQRNRQSGTLDVYDEANNVVRNLRLIRAVGLLGRNTVVFEMRDTNLGDILDVHLVMIEKDGRYTIDDIVLGGVKTIPQELHEEREYSDEEIIAEMRAYVAKQAKFTGAFSLFDEKKAGLRNLELMTIDSKLRRYGVLAITTAQFKDKDSGEMLEIDITAKNKDGRLDITKLKIKRITK